MPVLFKDDPARITEINDEIAKFKTQTGLDARAFQHVAVGIKYGTPRPGVTTGDSVAVVNGTFDSGGMIAAGRIAAKGKYEEQTYKGKKITVFNVNDRFRIADLFNLKVNQLAVVAIDSHTLAMGDLSRVQETLDGSGRTANANLLAASVLATNSFLGFSSNVPAGIAENVPMSNDEIAKNINSITQVYGSVGVVEDQLEMSASAKTHNDTEAQSLTDTLSALKQFGAMLAGQLPVDVRQLAQNGLDNLQIEHVGDQENLRLRIPQSDIASLMKTINKKKKA